MRKLFNLTVFFCIIVTSVFAQKPSGNSSVQKVGFINVDSVLVNLKEYTNQVKILEAFQKQLTAEYEVKNLEFENKYKDFQEKEKTLLDAEKKSKIEALQALDQELNKMRQESNKKIADKEKDLLVPLNEKILKAISIVAKNKGYSFVTDRKNFYFVEDAYDITKLVTDEANKL